MKGASIWVMSAAVIGGTAVFGTYIGKQKQAQEEADRQAAEVRMAPRTLPPLPAMHAPKNLPGEPANKTTALNMLNSANHGALVEMMTPIFKQSATPAAKSAARGVSSTTRTQSPAPSAVVASAAAKPPARTLDRLNGGQGLSGGIEQPFTPMSGGGSGDN